MNKKNNKGFLLAESLIVTTFVLTVLIYLFTQFKNLMTEYKKNYSYNAVQDIYNLGSLGSYITKNSINLGEFKIIYINNKSTLIGEYQNFFENMANNMNIDYIIYEDSDIERVKENINKYDQETIGQDMIDFIEKVKTTKIEKKGRLIAKFINGHFATIVIEKNES